MKRLLPPVVLIFMLVSCGPKEETLKVSVQPITESVYASGTIKARNQYQVFSTVNGIIRKLEVQEGDLVKKDQPIIRLVNDASRLAAENASLAAANATVGSNMDRLNELRINIDLARSRLQNDSLLLERQRQLWNNQIGTRNELDQRELAYRNSYTAYRAAQLRYSDLQRQVQFGARQSSKNLQISSSLLNDYTIKSKVPGKVYSVMKEEGELVTVQTPIAIIGDATDFYLELQVDEYDISRIRAGQKVLLSMDSYKGSVFEALIDRIDPIMDERSRSFRVEAVFTKQPAQLYPNLTAEANIIIQTRDRVITIPRNYLVGDTMVLLPHQEKRNVETGLKDYQNVEIRKGLSPGDVIVKPL